MSRFVDLKKLSVEKTAVRSRFQWPFATLPPLQLPHLALASGVFEDSKENKLEYTTLFERYTELTGAKRYRLSLESCVLT